MATVYLAIQESFERKVAIKVMSPQLAQDPAFGDRFQREARIVSQMNHPNIVTVYDVGVVDNHHYLAMQYIDGKELRHRMKNMSLAEKVRVVKEIASALTYAGNKGYVHRDVKPENIMLSDEDGRAILMDFGIAKTSDNNHSMTKTGMAIGTPYYMSPEQAQGKPVDKRSDIYSLGVMFFQMLTGRVPYDAESQVAIGIKHITEPIPFLPKHLRVFQPIIDKVMAKDPANRYQAGADLIRDLDRISFADLDEVKRIAEEEIASASQTDPHAATVMAEATPLPPTLNTGNVTTADAARLARRLAAEPKPAVKQESPASPIVAIIVIVLVIAAAGWFFTQKKSSPAIQSGTDAPVTAVSDVPETVIPVNEQAIEDEQKIVADHEAAIRTAEEKRKQEEAAALAAEEKRKQEEAAAVAAESKRKQEELAAKAAEEKRKQEELAAKAAEEKRKQEESAAARLAEQKRQAEMARIAEEKKQQEMIRAAEQKKQQQLAALLARAEGLREQGKLVAPANDNAVMVYRELLVADPDNNRAKSALVEIEKSYLMGIRYQIDEGKLDEASAKLREANAVFPNSILIAELLALHQKKTDEIAAAKVEASKPRITKILVNDAAFESMQMAQKNSLPIGRTAYIGIGYQNFEGATSLLQAVLYDGSRTLKIIQKPVVLTGSQGAVFFTLARPVEGFEDGVYNLDFLMGDQKLSSMTFTVKH